MFAMGLGDPLGLSVTADVLADLLEVLARGSLFVGDRPAAAPAPLAHARSLLS
jgi:hypothetical protein